VVGQEVVAGTVDRLLIEEGRILVVDFKTGRRVPASAEAAPEHHLRQMSAYAAALEVIFPGRRVEAALLYTAGPRLIALPAALVALHKQHLTA
jgi:ATP-dependent helicase/nuclease subunit A